MKEMTKANEIRVAEIASLGRCRIDETKAQYLEAQ